MIRDYTDFIDNSVGIDPAGCGCTDCITGNSVPLNSGDMPELARQAARGRPLTNRCGQPLVLNPMDPSIREVPEDFPDRWRFSNDKVTNLLDFVEEER
ncbi:hypothetical protein AB0H76_15065 [Nocardia sp. NPDC050712]|uniref:hypothetical protein n=1 Tax=Nocardia sp. NPDC050712 TaxID=3155518 RepID=UPI0033F97B99